MRRAKALIQRFEGLQLDAYVCPGGKLTIGYGSTRDVKAGMRITHDEAEQRLAVDMAEAAAHVTRLVKVPLTESMLGALVSFTYNLGAGNLGSSTLLAKLNIERDYLAVPEQLCRWRFAARRPLLGLARRRAAEAMLFLEDNLP